MIIKQLDEEPWAALDIKDLSKLGREDLIKFNQQNRQFQKYQFYLNAFDFIHDTGVTGDYFEFGCHKARTFRMAINAARLQMIENIDFYAFDSFEGHPNYGDNLLANPKWSKNQLFTSVDDFLKMIKKNGVYVDHVHVTKGFYEKTLNVELKKALIAKKTKAALITIDCDLYKSAVAVFGFIKPFLQEGTVIYIDDYYNSFKGNPYKGIPVAFNEFKKRTFWRFESFLNVGWWGRSFLTYK